MEFIGEGSYGCVVKPGEKCYKKIKKNIITKIFIESKIPTILLVSITFNP